MVSGSRKGDFQVANLVEASKQWATRPAEERYTSIPAMLTALEEARAYSHASVVSSRRLGVVPTDDNRGLYLEGPGIDYAAPTNWAFGQLAALSGAPAAYLRTLPAPLAADCLNYGLRVERDAIDTGVLLTTRPGSSGTYMPPELRAATGPRYGRIWNADVVRAIGDRFGDGVTGDFRVPGIFGKSLDAVTIENTTLFAGDRDMFVFLADEENRIELPDRRDGKTGQLARGFFVTNSETGAGALKIKTFLFDYVCANRIVWGAHELDEIAIRHTASAPDRFLEEAVPALLAYSNASAANVSDVLRTAQQSKLDNVNKFLASRFGPRIAERIAVVHQNEEGRPIESVFDAVTGATAYARSIPWTAERVDFEARAGEMLDA